jgi:hypothetical protein
LPTGTIVIQDVEKGGYIAEDDTVSNEMIVIDDFALFVTVRRSGDRETPEQHDLHRIQAEGQHNCRAEYTYYDG